MDALGRLPAQQIRKAREKALGRPGDGPRLRALGLREMNLEIGRLERAPGQARIDERELRPLRRGERRPERERRGEGAEYLYLLFATGFFSGQ
jgi:hypothetical protein